MPEGIPVSYTHLSLGSRDAGSAESYAFRFVTADILAVGSGSGGRSIVFRIVVNTENSAGDGIDFIVVFRKAVFVVEFHLIFSAAVVVIHSDSDECHLIFRQSRMVQGDGFRFFLSDIGAGIRSGIYTGVCTRRCV